MKNTFLVCYNHVKTCVFLFQVGTILLRYLPNHCLFHTDQPFLGHLGTCLLRGKTITSKYIANPLVNGLKINPR